MIKFFWFNLYCIGVFTMRIIFPTTCHNLNRNMDVQEHFPVIATNEYEKEIDKMRGRTYQKL